MSEANHSDNELLIDYLFVYGTLLHNSQSNAHQQYLRNADFISPAKIRGELFVIDEYPGLCLTNDDEEWVKGELYLLADSAQLHHLDVYEGCAPHSPQPHEYKRDLVEIVLPNNDITTAWTYIYIGDTSQLSKITSGDFLDTVPA